MTKGMYEIWRIGDVEAYFNSEIDAEQYALRRLDNKVRRILVQNSPINPYFYYNGQRLIDANFLARRFISNIPAYELEDTTYTALFDAMTDYSLDWLYLNPSSKFSKYVSRSMYAFVRDLLDSVAHAIDWSKK